MKIVCESCGAKYSIADDRVVGKMFKIRCKRCSEVIVVRGDQQAAAPAASPPAGAGPSSDQSWHVVVEGEQAGPYTAQQLQEMLGRSAIDWETYVWTEGYENWVAMREVEALVAQLGGPQARAAAAPAASPRARATSDAFASGQASMGADPFADDPAPAATSDLFSEARAPASDLFAARPVQSPAPAPSYRDGDGGVMVAAPVAARAAAPERSMTGARNENSVLFSLKNLQALATGSGSGSTPPAAAAPGDRGGYASGEGSGLIDIRALATATGVNDTVKKPAQRDDLLAMGTQGGAFGALASPMLSPATPEDPETTRKSIVWGVVASVALLSLSAVVIVYMIRSPAEAPARPIVEPPTAHPGAEPTAATAPPAPTHAAGSEPAVAPSQAPTVAPPPTAAAQLEGEREPAHAGAEHPRRHASEGTSARDSSSAKAAGDEAPKTLPAAVAAPRTRTKEGPQTLDELLDGALTSSGPKAQGGEAVAPAANLPDTPTREEVLSAMTGVKNAVQGCSTSGGAVATVTVNVAGATGHVTNAQVAGVTGPEGSCIAQAVRKATFPRFAQKVFKVTFPYKL